VWRGGWYAETPRIQLASGATPLASWWGAGRAPMLVIQGLQDALALPENGRSLKIEFGDRVTLVELDGAGHALLPEQPEIIAKTVLAYIARL
jgi:pimeloyl-ACP methyl ester carboxylesterase